MTPFIVLQSQQPKEKREHRSGQLPAARTQSARAAYSVSFDRGGLPYFPGSWVLTLTCHPHECVYGALCLCGSIHEYGVCIIGCYSLPINKNFCAHMKDMKTNDVQDMYATYAMCNLYKTRAFKALERT